MSFARAERRRQQRWAQHVMRRAGIALKGNVRSCDTPWARDDAAWFVANPQRAHRIRPPFAGELQARAGTVLVVCDERIDPELPTEDNCQVLVRQIEPGLRVSMALCWALDEEPIPNVEAIAHAVFDLLARKTTERAEWIYLRQLAALVRQYAVNEVVMNPH
jgi:hypothetical protein